MSEPCIIIPKTVLDDASPAFRRELATLIGLGADPNASEGQQPSTGSKLVELDEAAARIFLAGCGAKVTRVLTLIVRQKGTFYLRDLERSARAATNGLRGVWTGLTKRARTITGDPDAKLIGWQQRGDDYEGWISPTTCSSLKAALGI